MGIIMIYFQQNFALSPSKTLGNGDLVYIIKHASNALFGHFCIVIRKFSDTSSSALDS